MMKGRLPVYVVGNNFISLLLEIKEDFVIPFCNNLYPFGANGMYLNPRSLNLSPHEYVPKVVPV